MWSFLTEKFEGTLKRLKGQHRLTQANIQESLKEIRASLIEADVAVSVVDALLKEISDTALNTAVEKKLDPSQAFIKIVRESLTRMMGEKNDALNLRTQPPAVILMAGLQGAGKTTTAAKLAKLLKEKQKKSILLASCDVYRPAAMEQLKILAGQLHIDYFDVASTEKPENIAKQALDFAKKKNKDILIVDTAGRLAIDHEMMIEIKKIHAVLNPIETLFVVDSMTGQDAANTAKAFHEALPLTGVILTKADSDARGGAALSIRAITGKPIKFLGMGEKLDALQPFHPERLVSQILGMGDMLTLIDDLESKVDKEKADKLSKKLQKGKSFHLQDFAEQLDQMLSLGDMNSLVKKLPSMAGKSLPANSQKQFKKMRAIIYSMTPQERQFPDILKASRKERIAKGSGTTVQDVNVLLKQFLQAQTLMKSVAKNPRHFKQFMS